METKPEEGVEGNMTEQCWDAGDAEREGCQKNGKGLMQEDKQRIPNKQTKEKNDENNKSVFFSAH